VERRQPACHPINRPKNSDTRFEKIGRAIYSLKIADVWFYPSINLMKIDPGYPAV
jgi:hypothetical protein